MKATIKALLLLAASATFVASCDDLLEEKPKYGLNSTVVFANEDTARLALLGVYSYMSANQGYGQMWQEVPIACSGLTWGQRASNDMGGMVQMQMQPTNSEVYMAWKGMYKVISESNSFLNSLSQGSLSDAANQQLGGEVRFLRALAYYNLVTTYGGVPLKTSASSSDELSTPRASEEAIFNQVIEDFTYAAEHLSTTSDDGRANAWAAKAYLGKVYWRMALRGYNREANLQKAKEYFDDVYQNGPYKLQADFAGLFGRFVTGSPESIFQLNFSVDAGSDSYNRGSNRFSPQASTSGVCWSTFRVQKYMYDLQRGTYPGDARLEATYLTHWRARSGNNQANPKDQVGTNLCVNDSTYTYPYATYNTTATVPGTRRTKLQAAVTIPYDYMADAVNPDTAVITHFAENHHELDSLYRIAVGNMVTKFTAVGSADKWPYYAKMYDQAQTGTMSHKNLMVYRYAEMLLIMADVYNELGDTQRAIALAEEVLTRARALSTSGQPAAWSTSLTKDEVTEKLYFERIFELAGEPDIYDMTRCHGTEYLKKLLEYNNAHQITILAASKYATNPNVFLDFLYGDNGQLTESFLTKNLYLPIPQSEIDGNPGLSNDDQNPGY